VADLGIASSTLSLFTVDQICLAKQKVWVDLAHGPASAVPALLNHFNSLVASVDASLGKVEICVIAVPDPVDGRRSGVTRPPLLPDWESFALADAFHQALGCPILIDKDVNLRALGESRRLLENQRPLVLEGRCDGHPPHDDDLVQGDGSPTGTRPSTASTRPARPSSAAEPGVRFQ